jgi:hypothetical protein
MHKSGCVGNWPDAVFLVFRNKKIVMACEDARWAGLLLLVATI